MDENEKRTPKDVRLDRLMAKPLVKHLWVEKIAALQALPRDRRRVELAKLRRLAKKGARWVANRKGP